MIFLSNLIKRIGFSPSILDPSEEWNQLCLTLIFLLLVLVEIFLIGFFWFTPFIYALSTIAAIHHLFTLDLLLNLPEMKNWIILKTKNRPWLFWVLLSLTYVFLLWLFNLSFKAVSAKNIHLGKLLAGLYFLDTFLFSSFHMLYQSMGISMLYSHKFKMKDSGNQIDIPNMKSWIQIERWLVRILLTGVVIGSILASDYFENVMDSISHSNLIKIVAISFTSIPAFLIVLLAYRWSKLGLPLKFAFSIRFLIWPFFGYSLIAAAGLRIIHGYEYYLVSKKMKKSSQHGNPKIFAGLTLGLALLYLAVLLLRKNGLIEYILQSPPSIKANLIISVAAIYTATNLVHIIIDSMIFKMRKSVTRETTMKLRIRSLTVNEI